jgi:hypothetical protein
MGKRKTAIVNGFELDGDTSKPAGDTVSAVLERRKHGSKSDRIDWLRLVQAHRTGEHIPPAIAQEVFNSAGFEGDSWLALHTDAKDLGNYFKGKSLPSYVSEFEKKHGSMDTLVAQAEDIKDNLKEVQELVKQLRTNKQIEHSIKGPAMVASRNRRLFPDLNETLLSEAGINER